jgi:ubiquinone/menaquinone biosynthesis C-methylase UbiE
MHKDSHDNLILQFYQKVAKNFGLRSSSTMQDPTIRQMEMRFIFLEIDHYIHTHEAYPKILDIGCGNGTLLEALRDRYPKIPLYGLEFTPELYQLAISRNISDCQIILGDMRKVEDYPQDINIIISERALINLANWKQQKTAIDAMAERLLFPGRLILMESFFEPWIQLNQARSEMRLSLIPVSVQNVYLKEKSARYIEKKGFFERKTQMGQHALSNHFYLSRVFHPATRPDQAKGKFSRLVEFLENSLPKSTGQYSPILFRSFEKKLDI